MRRKFDLVTMGRTLLDMYGEQVGCRLEDITSFSKYVGGCPANIAIGAARLGLRVGHITRVGEDHHGRFLREQLGREGIDTACVRSDISRLTAVAFLGIRDKQTFPMVHYRKDCADMAISPEDYSPEYIGSATALLVSGSHLTTKSAESNLHYAVNCARRYGTRVVFDIDFRPLFWGLVPKDAGESRFVASEMVTRAVQRLLPLCDLVVGTEEEMHIAGGVGDTLEALHNIRALTSAALVLKRGPLGCVVFPEKVPNHLDQGIVGEGFPVEIFNVVGAGDGFLAGFLSAWIRDNSWQECCRRGNACGALVVSRHGCSPAAPTATELEWFLENAGQERRLFDNRTLERLHRATTRRTRAQPAVIVVCDSDIAVESKRSRQDKDDSKWIALVSRLLARIRAKHRGVGLALEGSRGEDALAAVGASLDWVIRRIDLPNVAPLQFKNHGSPCVTLRGWPQFQIVLCQVPRASQPEIAIQHERLRALQQAVEMWGHELMLSIDGEGLVGDHLVDAIVAEMKIVHALDVEPDWWGLPHGLAPDAWEKIERESRRYNVNCRGLFALETYSQADEGFARNLKEIARYPSVHGIAVGKSILARPVSEWTAGRLDDQKFENAVEASLEDFLATVVEGMATRND